MPSPRPTPRAGIAAPVAPRSALTTVVPIVRWLALAVGLAGTLTCISSGVGVVVETGWVRFPVAIVVALLVPAVLADRLLPRHAGEAKSRGDTRVRGLVGDVFALVWLGFTVLFVVALGTSTRGLLRAEGDRLARAGLTPLAQWAYLLSSTRATWPRGTTTAASASGSTSGSAPASASSVPAATSGSAPAAASTGSSAPDAGVPDASGPDAGGLDAGERSPADLFRELAPAVVTIAWRAGTDVQGGGTGFLVDEKGTIVTNHHVISGAPGLRIQFMDGSVFDEIELLTQDASVDLALLRVDLKHPKEGKSVRVTPLVLGDSDQVEVGQRAIAIGNPLGLDHTLTDGLISARRVYEDRNWLQISVPVSPGNSGGPLFDLRGRVIGITTAQIGSFMGRAQNLNLAVPVNVLKQLLRPDYPGRRKLVPGSGPSHW